MSAYVVIDIEVTDPDTYEEYKKLSKQAIEASGGTYLVRGGKTEVLEGDWSPSRLVILRFESMDAAREWIDSETYRHARGLRHAAAKTNMVAVEGL
ncbi:MAG: DUF1330 domain-containing protein [Acidobacteriota bacterium]